MRVRSDIFVAALVRRANGEGAFAVIERRGAAEAGAIFVVVDDRTEDCALYGPAIAGFERETEHDRDDRRFVPLGRFTGAELRERWAREARFDPDFWVVEIDDREGRSFLDDALVEE